VSIIFFLASWSFTAWIPLWFQRNPLPTDWTGQREVVSAFDAWPVALVDNEQAIVSGWFF
jgi:hypothetical protein